MQVYTDLLALLDKAIADLGGGGTGPAGHDLVYGGSAAKWIEAAHTLKARIYLHQVEKLGNAQYTSALAEARKGISVAGERLEDGALDARRRSATCGRNSRTRRSASISSPDRCSSTS